MTTDDDLFVDATALTLPAGVHAACLQGADVTNGETLTHWIVWADHVESTCGRCGEPIAQAAACPVQLDTGSGAGGTLQESSQQHGCGEWLAVDWVEVESDEYGAFHPDRIEAVAQEMHDQHTGHLDKLRTQITQQVQEDLRDVLAQLNSAESTDEDPQEWYEYVRTGSEMNPGVYADGAKLISWDWDPAEDPDTHFEPITAEVPLPTRYVT